MKKSHLLLAGLLAFSSSAKAQTEGPEDAPHHRPAEQAAFVKLSAEQTIQMIDSKKGAPTICVYVGSLFRSAMSLAVALQSQSRVEREVEDQASQLYTEAQALLGYCAVEGAATMGIGVRSMKPGDIVALRKGLVRIRTQAKKLADRLE